MTPPRPPIPNNVIDELPEILREPTRRWFARLIDEKGYGGTLPDSLVRLVACSEFAGTWLLRYPDWIASISEQLDRGPEVAFTEDAGWDEVMHKAELRKWRHRCLIHLLWRELAHTVPVRETLEGISSLAESLLASASRCAISTLRARFGDVVSADGETSVPVILGMGKLGGRELNFSSDIDIIFLYSRDGSSNGDRSISAQEYFTRYARVVVSMLDEVTSESFAFRVDTRLRPFGDSGPPVTSFAALETYLLQHGRDWERYAYVKAREVGTAAGNAINDELFSQTITPFVYRRYLDYGVFDSLRSMHAMIAAEVQKKEFADNIKLGAGGIRDTEFAVQSLQLVRGGSQPVLQGQSLLSVLPRLAGRDSMSETTAAKLADAYVYLRRLENFIQALRDRQTHDLPQDPADQARLALAMNCNNWAELVSSLDNHRQYVAEVFADLAFGDEEQPADDSRTRYSELFASRAAQEDWQALLSAPLAELLTEFATTVDARQVDAVAAERLNRFVGNLVARSLAARSPERALRRTLSVIENVLRRSAYIALLNENPAVLDRLVTLCEKSGYLTRQIGRYPVLLDELLDPRVYSQPATAEGLVAEIRERLQATASDSEAQTEALARFQRASQFRIAAADFSGNLPLMRVSDHLTELAEVVLGQALEMAWRDMCERFGAPASASHGNVAGFGIVAYGKLGGLELSYGSDLDLVFLHDLTGAEDQSEGSASIENGVFLSRLVRRLVHILSTQTGSGVLYEVDTRLRPDGQSGLLVSHIDAFERYQVNDAWTWEHQALLRARPVGGDPAIAARFDAIREHILSDAVDRDALKNDVISMRDKMRRNLDRSTADQFDIKQGLGGIGDIEFLVQYLVLREAKTHPAVIEYTDNIRQLDALADCGCLAADTAAGLQEIYRQYRMRVHHLALDDAKPLVGDHEFEDARRTVSELWGNILGS